MKLHLSRLGATLAASLTCFAAPGVAAELPRGSVEVVGESASKSSLEVDLAQGDETLGTLELPLLIRQAGRLQLSFVDFPRGERIPVPTLEGGAEELSIQGNVPADPLTVGDVYLLRLYFLLPDDRAGKLEGILSVSSGETAPIALPVEAAAAKTESEWQPTQKKIEIDVTRPFPLFFGFPEESVVVGVVGEGESQSTSSLDRTRLTLDHNGHAFVDLGAPGGKEEIKTARVTVTEASGIGTASSTLDLGDGEKAPQQLEVVVKVGDWILAPFLVVLIGALLGKLIPTIWDTRREAKMLRNKLVQAVEAYKEVHQEEPKPSNLEEIDEIVGPAAWRRGLALLPRGSKEHRDLVDQENQTAEEIYYRLGRVKSSWRLSREAKAAQSLINRVEGWIAVRKALVELAEEVPERSQYVDDQLSEKLVGAPFIDSEDLLDREISVDADIAKSTKLAKAISAQAVALQLCVKIEAAAWGLDQDGMGRELLERAGQLYRRWKSPLLRTEAEAEALLERLREVLYRIHHAQREPGPELARMDLDYAVAEVRFEYRSLTPAGILTRARDFIAPTKAPSPEQVMASVRRGDWAIAAAVFVISALAYLLPVYSSGPFGTWEQYLAAFVAGAGSQVAISNGLIPLLRSYEPTAGQAATATPGKAEST